MCMGMMGIGACQLVQGRISPMGGATCIPLRNHTMWQHMQQMMDSGMVWGMGLGSLILLILLILVIAALVKYIFLDECRLLQSHFVYCSPATLACAWHQREHVCCRSYSRSHCGLGEPARRRARLPR
jgi:hypothetical protein